MYCGLPSHQISTQLSTLDSAVHHIIEAQNEGMSFEKNAGDPSSRVLNTWRTHDKEHLRSPQSGTTPCTACWVFLPFVNCLHVCTVFGLDFSTEMDKGAGMPSLILAGNLSTTTKLSY